MEPKELVITTTNFFFNIFSVRYCNLRENLKVPLLTTSEVFIPLELSGALGTNNNNNKCVFLTFSRYGIAI